MPKKELTKSKLNKILKKYQAKLEQHNKEWEDLCAKIRRENPIREEGDKIIIAMPTIHQHEAHNSKGAQLFRSIMAEFDEFEVFPKKK